MTSCYTCAIAHSLCGVHDTMNCLLTVGVLQLHSYTYHPTQPSKLVHSYHSYTQHSKECVYDGERLMNVINGHEGACLFLKVNTS